VSDFCLTPSMNVCPGAHRLQFFSDIMSQKVTFQRYVDDIGFVSIHWVGSL